MSKDKLCFLSPIYCQNPTQLDQQVDFTTRWVRYPPTPQRTHRVVEPRPTNTGQSSAVHVGAVHWTVHYGDLY
jgi:hypothetical protein